jgi:twitching motility two-component system response regulator PilG
MTKQPAILYVEDDLDSREVMNILLTLRLKLPHVTILKDSTDFLSQALSLDPKPDVVFLDIHVAPHNGFEMLEMLQQRQEFQNTPVVALTASVMNEEVEQLRVAGFHSCIAKPIDSDTFQDALERILSGESLWRIQV